RVRIDRHRHGAERLAGGHRPIEPRAVRADDGEFLAALEAQLLQPDRERAHLVEHLGPGPGLPDAEILVTHRNAGTPRRRVVDQEFWKRVRLAGAPNAHESPPSTPRGATSKAERAAVHPRH